MPIRSDIARPTAHGDPGRREPRVAPGVPKQVLLPVFDGLQDFLVVVARLDDAGDGDCQDNGDRKSG